MYLLPYFYYIMKTTKPKGAKKYPFSLEVTVNDTHYRGEAVSLTEALKDFVASPEFPVGLKTKTIIRYGKGNDMHQQIWAVPKPRKVFNIISLKPDALEIWASKFEAELI